MDLQLLLLLGLTFLIHLIGSLAYSVRIAGVRTLRIAVSLSLFNILLLVSRTANSFQAPMLARRVEGSLAKGPGTALGDFRLLLAAASAATVAGALLTPTFQRLFTRAVAKLSVERSVVRLLLRSVSASGLETLRRSATVPALANVRALQGEARFPLGIAAINLGATAVWTVGVLASLYAAYLNPALRVTSSNLSALVNGVATLLLFIVVDPYLSLLTDDVIEGRTGEPFFRRAVVWMLASRLAGTLVAQVLLVPAATLVALVAARI